ncbi:hypothetical protein SPBR_01606 [Sporothrix brasiliensis 5110]|uniref:Zn(2)-C6 fungal-type domain-containing protein n=1 Tax=Sporothrix brasiliensis 5110 TaxID=1398154 RepID=A0A0C2IQ59_9PEZI|nr:uncharacterized protein SPBR_01606 [Sporothrix brasiliensis 5110]KIH91171.1 hypothetical protein SPBR_01606 [Sporothrix brasiliensis 5110]
MQGSSPQTTAASPASHTRKRRHFKSRLGCAICKRRKIKCDESRPGCANCAKHGVDCDFLNEPAAVPSRSNAASPDAPPASHSYLRSHFRPQPRPSVATPRGTAPTCTTHANDDLTPAQVPLQLAHLEMLHNFATSTALTLSPDPVLRTIWRLNAPREGFRPGHGFVLRSIFALSALHMAVFATDPAAKQQHLARARAEHGIALRDTAAALRHASASNCSAVFISATLTFLYAWACPRQPGDIFLVSPSTTTAPTTSHPSQPADWVFFLRGIRTITDAWSAELLRGPFGTMMRLGWESTHFTKMSAYRQRGGWDERDGGSDVGAGQAALVASPAWQATAEHAQFLCLRRTVARAAAADEEPIYQKSIDSLEFGFACTYRSMGTFHAAATAATTTATTPSTPSAMSNAAQVDGRPPGAAALAGAALTSGVYYWLYCMDDDFLDLIMRRRPLALVVFAHFVVLLRVLSSCWWMQGWTTHLMQEIWGLLDEDHRLWICWPIEELGWRPSV